MAERGTAASGAAPAEAAKEGRAKSRRWKIVALVGGALVVLTAIAIATGVTLQRKKCRSDRVRPREGGPPNIVFILTDDQDKVLGRLSDLPNIKKLLLEEGTTFDNFYVNYALCCPSRATILTGRCMHNTGVILNEGLSGGLSTFKANGLDRETLGTLLQSAGYRTALVGKYLNGYKIMREIPPGWDRWFVFKEVPGYYNYTVSDDGNRVPYGSEESDYSTDVIASKVVEFIQASSGKGTSKPFFAYVAPFAAHTPAIPPLRHRGKFAGAKVPRTRSFNVESDSAQGQKAWAVRKYPRFPANLERIFDFQHQCRQETLLAVDDLVKAVYDAVESVGALDNTYFVFTSDNGFHIGHHRMGGGKQSPYEMDVNVPLVVRGPGVPRNATLPHLVGNIDFYPTFAELAGANIESRGDVDGVSFAPLLKPDGGASVGPTDFRTAFLMEKVAFHETRTANSEWHGQGGGALDYAQARSVALTAVTQSVVEDSIGLHGEEYLDHYNDFRPLGLTNFYGESEKIGIAFGSEGRRLFPNCVNDGADLLPNGNFTLYACAALYQKYIAGEFNTSTVSWGSNQALRYVQDNGLSPLDYALAIGFGFPTTYTAVRARVGGYDYKLIRFPLAHELYNLTQDRDEIFNIFRTAPAPLVATLVEALDALIPCKGPTCHFTGSPKNATL